VLKNKRDLFDFSLGHDVHLVGEHPDIRFGHGYYKVFFYFPQAASILSGLWMYCASCGLIVKHAPDGFTLRHCGSAGHFITHCHHIGKGNADFSFTGGNNRGAGLAQGSCVSEASAADQNLHIGIEKARLFNDFGGVFYIHAENQTAGRRDACVLECPRTMKLNSPTWEKAAPMGTAAANG